MCLDCKTSNNLYIDAAELNQQIESLHNVLSSMGSAFAFHTEKLNLVRDQLSTGRIHLAVLGQFKRGKSSLLNALLGEELLPSSVIPLTSVPTYIKFSKERRVCVSFSSVRNDEILRSDSPSELNSFLSKYVSEESNPENHLQVERVELFYNSDFLSRGVVLIDTPGIGSTHRHNTEVTLNFLPQCDAALFLISADPPITDVEIGFLRKVKTRIHKIFYILNKIDYLSDNDMVEVSGFISRVMREKADIYNDLMIFPVSARNFMEALKTNDSSLREKSGIDSLVEMLNSFMRQEKQAVLNSALTVKIQDILNDADMQLKLEVKTFKMPVDELEEKIALFDAKIVEAEYQKTASSDMLKGEMKRLLNILEEQADSLRKKSRSFLESLVNRFFSNDKIAVEREIQEKLAEKIPVFFEHELGEMSAYFNKRVIEIISQHHLRYDEIIDSVRKNASDIFEIPYYRKEGASGMIFEREPFWVIHEWKSSLSPIPEDFIDRFIPGRLRNRRIRRRIDSQIEGIIRTNVENLRWSTLQNLNLTFRRFMSGLDERFSDIISVTRKAVRQSMEKRDSLSGSTADEINRLSEYEMKFKKIKESLDLIKQKK